MYNIGLFFQHKIPKRREHSRLFYFLGFAGGLFPLPPPDGLPVVLGPLFGFGLLFAIFIFFEYDKCIKKSGKNK